MINTDTCILYEIAGARRINTSWTALSGAMFDLNSYAMRPKGWRSADLAGLPVFPLLLRLDEVMSGFPIDHPLRFTMQRTRTHFLWPARHHAGATNSHDFPPMGARFRLKSGFDITGFRSDTQVVLLAMKTYGLILADKGHDWQIQGERNAFWESAMIDELKTIPVSQFEAVDVYPIGMGDNTLQVQP